MRRGLGLKRKENAGQEPEAEKKRAGTVQPAAPAQPTQTAAQQCAVDAAAWAAEPAAAPRNGGPSPQRAAAADSPPAAQQPAPGFVMDSGEDEEALLGQPPSPPGDEETRQGLLKVVESMRRRVDAGHLQLLRQRALLQQKQQLVARGEAVLAQHCRASWQQPSPTAALLEQLGAQREGEEEEEAALARQLRQLGAEDASVHSMEAGCTRGQWWLRAAVSLPPHLLQHLQAGSCRASLLAASPHCGLVCRQQHCSLGSSDSGGGSSAGGSGGMISGSGGQGPPSAAPAAEQQRVHLSALLDVQHAEHGQQADGEPFADVFLLLEQVGRAEGITAALLEGPPAAPPVPLGRVQLSWQQWLQSHSADPARPPFPVPPPQPPQHSRALAVSSEQLDLQCLHTIVQQQLGLAPAPPEARQAAAAAAAAAAGGTDGSVQTSLYLLPGAGQQPQPADGSAQAAAAAPAASVGITQHSSRFAEVRLEASSSQLFEVLQQQLAAGLRQAAAAAGAPPDDASLQPSLLGPQHAQRQAAVADCLVRELDASIEWVEALLKEKLALSSQARRQKVAPDPVAVRRAQAAALAALAATDGALISMLTESGC